MSAQRPPQRWVEVGADAICGHVRSHLTPALRDARILYCPECEGTARTLLQAALPLADSLAAEAQEHVLRADSLRAHLNEQAAEYDELWGQWDELCAQVQELADALPDDDLGPYALGRRHTYWEILGLLDEAGR